MRLNSGPTLPLLQTQPPSQFVRTEILSRKSKIIPLILASLRNAADGEHSATTAQTIGAQIPVTPTKLTVRSL